MIKKAENVEQDQNALLCTLILLYKSPQNKYIVAKERIKVNTHDNCEEPSGYVKYLVV